jgi:lipopolysaccharide biosynthesis glycosyltransferase
MESESGWKNYRSLDAFIKYYRSNIDLDKDDIMFNSGVMLIDLEKWWQQCVEDRLLKFIASKNGRIQQGDQGALNHVLSHDTYCFEPRFNSVTIFYDFTYEEMLIYRRPPMFYTKEQVREAIENPSVIHFTTNFLSKRAWVKGCKHHYVDEWLKYKKMSPWRDEALWDDNRPKWKQTGADIISVMPRRMAVRIAGLMQVYSRPLINKIKS